MMYALLHYWYVCPYGSWQQRFLWRDPWRQKHQSNQYGPFPEARTFGDHTQKRRSLDTSRPLVTVQEIGTGGRWPPVTTYQNKMKDAKWLQENYHFLSNVSEDIMWLLLRLNSDSLFDDNHYPVAHQKITGCGGYQSIKLTKTSLPTAS